MTVRRVLNGSHTGSVAVCDATAAAQAAGELGECIADIVRATPPITPITPPRTPGLTTDERAAAVRAAALAFVDAEARRDSTTSSTGPDSPLAAALRTGLDTGLAALTVAGENEDLQAVARLSMAAYRAAIAWARAERGI